MSAANWSEVVQKMISRRMHDEALRGVMEAAGLTILDLTADDAERAARLWQQTHTRGLSLGDRCCLALADRLHVPAVTTERLWDQLDLGIQVHLIR